MRRARSPRVDRAIYKCQPIRRESEITQSVDGCDVGPLWDVHIISWWECLLADLCLVVDGQEAGNNSGYFGRRWCSLQKLRDPSRGFHAQLTIK
jgi:hypothetical protein